MLKKGGPKTVIAKVGLIVAIMFGPLLLLYIAITSQYPTKTVTIGSIQVIAQIATSSQQKEKGLCCRESLPANRGMLFVYDTPGVYRYWMKDTKIPLDMFWISAEKRVVYIQQNVQPASYPATFGPGQPAKYVLEANAGFAKQHAIVVGDHVSF